MVLFLECFLQYLLIMAALVIVGGLGVFIGIKLRKSKNAKVETEE